MLFNSTAIQHEKIYCDAIKFLDLLPPQLVFFIRCKYLLPYYFSTFSHYVMFPKWAESIKLVAVIILGILIKSLNYKSSENGMNLKVNFTIFYHAIAVVVYPSSPQPVWTQ